MEVKGVRGGREGRGLYEGVEASWLGRGTPKRSEWYRKEGVGCWRNALFVGPGGRDRYGTGRLHNMRRLYAGRENNVKPHLTLLSMNLRLRRL